MAIPPSAVPWDVPMDPRDLVEFVAQFGGYVLEEGETIVDWTATLSPEAVALGVEIVTEAPRAGRLVEDDRSIELWFRVDPEFQANAAFSGGGLDVGVEYWIETNSSPSREFERTKVLTVAQQ